MAKWQNGKMAKKICSQQRRGRWPTELVRERDNVEGFGKLMTVTKRGKTAERGGRGKGE